MTDEFDSINTRQETTDEELIARFQNGDNYAFDLLVKRYKDPLMNFIFRFVGEKNEAEDIVQETFLRLFKNKHYYKEIAKFSTWIYTIAGNLAKTELRKRKRRKLFSISHYMATERDIQGFSYEEVAEIVNIPLGTVKSRVNRARLRLQEDLKDLMDDTHEQ